MRTLSQTFADLVLSKEDAKAQSLLAYHGIEKTGALNTLAIRGTVSPEWLAVLNKNAHTSNTDHQGAALLLTLAVPTNWARRNQYVQWLGEQQSSEWYKSKSPLHHASFHGDHDAFDTLEQMYFKHTGEHFDWNSVNGSGHTPLYLALSQGHLETVVHVIKKGGLPHQMVNNPKSPGQKISVLNLVFQEKASVLSYMKEVWESAREKAALQSALEETPTAKTTKKKSKKI